MSYFWILFVNVREHMK